MREMSSFQSHHWVWALQLQTLQIGLRVWKTWNKDSLRETSGSPDSINCNHCGVSGSAGTTHFPCSNKCWSTFHTSGASWNSNVFSRRSVWLYHRNGSKGSAMKQTTEPPSRKAALCCEVLWTRPTAVSTERDLVPLRVLGSPGKSLRNLKLNQILLHSVSFASQLQFLSGGLCSQSVYA